MSIDTRAKRASVFGTLGYFNILYVLDGISGLAPADRRGVDGLYRFDDVVITVSAAPFIPGNAGQLSEQEAALFLTVSLKALREWRNAGIGPAHVGVLYEASALASWAHAVGESDLKAIQRRVRLGRSHIEFVRDRE